MASHGVFVPNPHRYYLFSSVFILLPLNQEEQFLRPNLPREKFRNENI